MPAPYLILLRPEQGFFFQKLNTLYYYFPNIIKQPHGEPKPLHPSLSTYLIPLIWHPSCPDHTQTL